MSTKNVTLYHFCTVTHCHGMLVVLVGHVIRKTCALLLLYFWWHLKD